MNYWLIFLTGLTSGGFSCMAVQGGLLAATLANQDRDSHPVWPTLMFVGSKVVAYTILGALLGYFGSFFQLSNTARVIFQILAAVMMFGLAANMLQLHPIFRYFVIQPPKWIGRLLRNQTNSRNLFAPGLMGGLTVLIPCGVTQAMEVLAISSGNPVSGAGIMASFTLGTGPVFLALGFLTNKLSEASRARFYKVAAIIVLYLALSSFNGALVLSGSKYAFHNWVWAFEESFLPSRDVAINQNITIEATSRGYSPNKVRVRVGQPVTLTVATNNNFSCTSIFTIPALGVNKTLPETGTTTIEFTPKKPGPITFTCGMGMFSGIIEAVL